MDEELEGEATCADCGIAFWASLTGGYFFGEDRALCYDCALRRGGSFDAEHDRWSIEPGIADLLDELRPRPPPP